MSKTSKITYFFISVIFFILFDLYFSNLLLKYSESISGNSVFDIVSVQNSGAAFSILQNSKAFLIGFSAVAIIAISAYMLKHIKNTSVFGVFWTSMLVSGIFCNMYERISLGYVRDFFKLNFVNFPVFNISDMFINISVFAIVVIIVKHSFSKA